MTSFSPLNFYTFAAARGEFLRPDVRALPAGASVGPFSRVTIWHDGMLQSVPDPKSAAIRKRLDALGGLESSAGLGSPFTGKPRMKNQTPYVRDCAALFGSGLW